jgi:hypothetical protein
VALLIPSTSGPGFIGRLSLHIPSHISAIICERYRACESGSLQVVLRAEKELEKEMYLYAFGE